MDLERFHPAVSDWFTKHFPAPTLAQQRAWPSIKERQHTLIAAPTGSGKTAVPSQSVPPSLVIDPGLMLSTKKVKEADDAAYRARMDAEETFDQAEKQLSTRLAREGCRKAIQSWELHEKAIRKAEALLGSQ